ncbi:hypothetical protein C8T65DRAFT_20925 [Cerioporus squamosus]|nr:hypothetical protein C8T65DRAFT_20925 [Cerioporus squamosus]
MFVRALVARCSRHVLGLAAAASDPDTYRGSQVQGEPSRVAAGLARPGYLCVGLVFGLVVRLKEYFNARGLEPREL